MTSSKYVKTDWNFNKGLTGYIPIVVELQIVFTVSTCLAYLFLFYVGCKMLFGREENDENEQSDALHTNIPLKLPVICNRVITTSDGGNTNSNQQQTEKNKDCNTENRAESSEQNTDSLRNYVCGANNGGENGDDDDDDGDDKRKRKYEKQQPSGPSDNPIEVDEKPPKEKNMSVEKNDEKEVSGEEMRLRLSLNKEEPMSIDQQKSGSFEAGRGSNRKEQPMSVETIVKQQPTTMDADKRNSWGERDPMAIDEDIEVETDSNGYSDSPSDSSMASSEETDDAPAFVENRVVHMWGSKELEEIKNLGAGGFGTCILVQNKTEVNGQMLLALKKIASHNFRKEEVEILGKLGVSPFTVAFLGYAMSGSQHMLLFEFAQGGDMKRFLSDWRKANCREIGMIKYWFREILEAYAYIHSEDIIHADPKSDNILMISKCDGSYRPVLSDFGLSIDCTSREYQSGVMRGRGAIRYRSPEMIINNICNSFASDIWGTGCILLEMDTGDPPWKDAAMNGDCALIFKIGTAKEVIPDTVSLELMSLYMATLDFNPVERRTARDILDREEYWNSDSD